MSHSGLFSTVRSSDHDFIAALRFLDDYAKHIHERGPHHQVYRNFVPRFDLVQHGDTYQLYGELPGFRREDVTIEAHDDHNLQVSGSISPVTSQTSPPRENNEPRDANGSTAESSDQKVAKEATNGQEQKLSPKHPSGAKASPSASHHLESKTTNQERYLNARFGDVLDPHAEFLRGPDDAVEASPEGTDTMPEIRYLIAERHPCSFHRAFHFPTPIRKDEITSTMQDGILHIAAPRAPMPPPVKVEVRDVLEYSTPLII